jgi:hypothetical protein
MSHHNEVDTRAIDSRELFSVAKVLLHIKLPPNCVYELAMNTDCRELKMRTPPSRKQGGLAIELF